MFEIRLIRFSFYSCRSFRGGRFQSSKRRGCLGACNKERETNGLRNICMRSEQQPHSAQLPQTER